MSVYVPGDILLVNDYSGSTDVLGNLIRAGERARYGDSDWARWTHSALITSQEGHIVEAMQRGVELGHVDEYSHVETLVVSPPIDPYPHDPRRGFACRFAESHIGDKYNVIDFVSLAGTLITGLDLSLTSERRFICSQLVARATESYTTSGYQYPCEQMMPADLGAYWNALSGRPLPPPSFMGRCLDLVKIVGRAVF